MTLTALVRYHIPIGGQHEMLKLTYGLMADESDACTVYERRVPLNGHVAAALTDPLPEPPPMACLSPTASKG